MTNHKVDPGEGQKSVLNETGERPITAADHVEAVLDIREDLQDSLVTERSSQPPASQREVQIDPEVLSRISELLKMNTLEAHKEALKILKGSNFIASKRWNAIHSDPEARHEFSKVSKRRVNSFAEMVRREVLTKLGPEAVVMDLGCGFGNDAKYMARRSQVTVQGVDIAERAIHEANASIDRCRTPETLLNPDHWTNRIALVHGDFFPDLEAWASMEQNLAVVYSHSTLHYAPPLVLRDLTFPLIARALTGNREEGKKPGKLCMAMKIAASASAKSPDQIRLVDDDPYNPSFDARDKMFRIYPGSKRHVLALVEPSHEIEYARVIPVRDYDHKGQTEVFCCLIASPRTSAYKAA